MNSILTKQTDAATFVNSQQHSCFHPLRLLIWLLNFHLMFDDNLGLLPLIQHLRSGDQVHTLLQFGLACLFLHEKTLDQALFDMVVFPFAFYLVIEVNVLQCSLIVLPAVLDDLGLLAGNFVDSIFSQIFSVGLPVRLGPALLQRIDSFLVGFGALCGTEMEHLGKGGLGKCVKEKFRGAEIFEIFLKGTKNCYYSGPSITQATDNF